MNPRQAGPAAEADAVGPDHESRSFDGYREYMAPLWNVSTVPDQIDPFRSATRIHHLGRAVLGRSLASSHLSERTGVHAARMGVDHLLVVARNSGRADLDLGCEERRSVANEVTILDLSRPFRASVTHVDVVTLVMPRVLLAPLVRDVDGLHGTVLRRDDPFGALAWEHLNGLAREAPRLRVDDAAPLIEASASLLAACADRAAPRSGEARARARPAVLVAVRRWVEEHLADADLSSEAIMRRFALSRSTIYRLFQPFGGVDTYIRKRRLARAFRMLRADREGRGEYVYQVGLACGFRSDSAFSHAFRREFGRTPRDVLFGAAAEPAPLDGLEVGRWLSELA